MIADEGGRVIRKIVAIIICLFPAWGAAETLTLEDALGLALRDSLQVELAGVERAQGKQALAEGVATAFPELSASYGTSGTSGAELGDSWDFGLTLTQPVVDATVVLSVVRGVRENDYYRAASARTVGQLILDVQNGYYNVAQAQALIATAEGQYRRAAENRKLVDKRHALGEATTAEELRAQADFLAAETELLSARQGLEDYRRVLSDLIGLDEWEPIDVEELPEPEEPESLPTTVISKASLAKNPDVTVLTAQAKASDVAYWRAWANLLPALSFSVSRGATLGEGSYEESRVGDETYYRLSVSLPVVNFFQRGLDINGARLDRVQSRLELAQAELEQRERMASLVAAQELAYKQWESAVKTLELNKEVYRLNARSYELGAVSFDELLQVEADLTQAERDLVQTQADYWSSRAELNYVLGTSLEE